MGDKSKIKKISIAIILLITLTSCGKRIDATKIQDIWIETINSNEKDITKIKIRDCDGDILKNIITSKKQYDDDGFVFAEGGYRVTVKMESGIVNLYPYCGDLETIRVGDSGTKFIDLDSNDKEKIELIIDKYVSESKKDGIWDWTKVSGK